MPSLFGLIARADLVISAVGLISWERIASRLLSLVFTYGRDQAPIAEALFQLGHQQLLDDPKRVSSHEIPSALLVGLES